MIHSCVQSNTIKTQRGITISRLGHGYITKIVVSEMKMLGGNKASDEHQVAEPVAKTTARNGNNGAAKPAKQAGSEPF